MSRHGSKMTELQSGGCAPRHPPLQKTQQPWTITSFKQIMSRHESKMTDLAVRGLRPPTPPAAEDTATPSSLLFSSQELLPSSQGAAPPDTPCCRRHNLLGHGLKRLYLQRLMSRHGSKMTELQSGGGAPPPPPPQQKNTPPRKRE
jgi:hypothetical protein